nr:uncharacterized protein LOC104121134 [Nicotiana tomentosiformis]
MTTMDKRVIGAQTLATVLMGLRFGSLSDCTGILWLLIPPSRYTELEPKRDETYTVKSAYLVASNSNQHIEHWPRRQIWKVKKSLKVVCFSWLMAREACLTQDKLRRSSFHLCSKCSLCGTATETNSHLFLYCPITDQLWQLFFNIVGLKWSMPENTCDLLTCWNYNGGIVRQKKWWRLVHTCIWCTVWKEITEY